MKKVSLREKKKTQKIKLIYDTFIQLLQKEGYDKLSTNHISEEAKIGIGTIYRYFPEGKAAIAKGYFEKIKDKIINEEFFKQVREKKNLEKIFEMLISRYIRIYRNNFNAFLAYQQALLANKELFDNYQASVKEFGKETVKKLKQENQMFKNTPEEQFIDRFLLIYNLIEALTNRHMVIIPLFKTDEELITYITNLILFTIDRPEIK
jgi:AcrR family transcriptional regulator